MDLLKRLFDEIFFQGSFCVHMGLVLQKNILLTFLQYIKFRKNCLLHLVVEHVWSHIVKFYDFQFLHIENFQYLAKWKIPQFRFVKNLNIPAICNRCQILPIQTKILTHYIAIWSFYLNLSIFLIGKCKI